MRSHGTARIQPPPKPVRRRRLDPEIVVGVEPLYAVEDQDLLDIDSGFTTLLEQQQATEPSSVSDVERSLEQRVALALAASTRAQANLRALFRTVKFLGASIGGARETNDHLLAELEALLQSLNDEQRGKPSQKRAKLLSRALTSATEQAVKEREFLIREHDNFIASMVADYERELGELRERLKRAEAELSSGLQAKKPAESGEYRVKPA